MKEKILTGFILLVIACGFLYFKFSLDPHSDLIVSPKKENTKSQSLTYNNEIDLFPSPGIIHKIKNYMDATELTIPSADLNKAMNMYRTSHGVKEVSMNQELCDYALSRAQDMRDLNAGIVLNEKGWNTVVMNHDRIDKEVRSGIIYNYIHGRREFGENIALAICRLSETESKKVMVASDVPNYCFDRSPKHKEVLLDPVWTDGCSVGKFPFYVEIFAK